MKMTKRVLAMLLAIMMLLTFAACGDKPEDPQDPSTEPTQAPVAKLPGATWSNHAVQCQGFELVTDYDGNDALRIYWDFTNNSDEANHANNAVRMELTQDGAELEEADMAADNESEYYTYGELSVRPGVKVRATEEFVVNKAGGAVHVKMYDFDNDDTEVLEFDVDLAKLPGKPQDTWTITPVADPKNVEGLTKGGVYEDDYEMTIDEIEMAKGYDGEDLVRVFFTFTNNSDEPENPWFASLIEVFQDNIELQETSASPQAETDSAFHKDVEPGATAKVSVCYQLRTDSPIEVELSNGWDPVYGARFDVK